MDRGNEEKGFLTPHQIEFLQGGDSKHERQTRRRIRNRLRGAMWDFRILAENMPVEERQKALRSHDHEFGHAVADAFRVLWTGLGQTEYNHHERRGLAEGETDRGNEEVVGMEIEYEPILRSELEPPSAYHRAVNVETGEVMELLDFVRRLRGDELSEGDIEVVELEQMEELTDEEASEMALQIAKSRRGGIGSSDASGEDSNVE